ncbi:hypothetical protein E3N88_43272 [Mikania micrantha]|uniref:Reverse transcriptase domain-containing protein n=1 Tax=Mikania micrantha TaxID=192012 RepID=A0A5N6LFH9_9ASTR|nr:hypothetical protein E3N88_43272 [Mikania micrantha]
MGMVAVTKVTVTGRRRLKELWLKLSRELSNVHPTFHVSNLKKCLADENLHMPLDEVRIDESMHFIEKPVKIVDREVKKLKNKRIPIVLVK